MDQDAVNPALGAVVELVHRFYACLDDNRYAELVALTTDDVRWLRQGEELRGHAAVLAALERRPTSFITRHVITNAHTLRRGPGGEHGDDIELAALMTTYRGRLDAAASLPVTIDRPFRLARLTVRCRRTNGAWKIADQEGIPTFEFAGAQDPRT